MAVFRRSEDAMKILSDGMRGCRKGPEEWFTGTVWIDEVVTGAVPSRLVAARVSFEPGARTAWHTHPVGQTLHVLTGLGRVQSKGEPVREIRPGDTVWIDAGEIHWHGAALGHTMVHLAMQETDEHGVNVMWLKHVTDAEYSDSKG
jgi:quercetin dioxygenase-like cupin family protein